MPAAPSEIPPNPKIAATIATIAKMTAQRNIILSVWFDRNYNNTVPEKKLHSAGNLRHRMYFFIENRGGKLMECVIKSQRNKTRFMYVRVTERSAPVHAKVLNGHTFVTKPAPITINN